MTLGGLDKFEGLRDEEDCYNTRVWTDFGLGLGLGP